MPNILIVIGSARKGRVADKIVNYVQSDIAKRDGITTTIADLDKIQLPFFDNENFPQSPEYTITNPAVKAFSELVQAADSVLFITPEYNHTLTAIQKNALDSLGPDWVEKPTTAIAYGWTGGSRAVATLREVLGNLKAEIKQNITQLAFTKDIHPDGTILDQESVTSQIAATIDEIV